MGFWDKAADLAGKTYQVVNKKAGDLQDEISRHMDYYERYSDEQLKREFKSISNSTRRIAIGKILKDRGY